MGKKMKSFDEWFDTTFGEVKEEDPLTYFRMMSSWQAAQEVQRESDADMVQSDFEYKEEYDVSWGFDLANMVRNNKAV